MAEAVEQRNSSIANLRLWLSPATPLIVLLRTILKFMPFARLGTGEKAQAYYNSHNDRMRKVLGEWPGRKRDYLEFNVKQGWGPLCAYLGRDVPEGEFPRSNDKEHLGAKIQGLKVAMDQGARRNLLKGLSVALFVTGVAVLVGSSRKNLVLWSDWLRGKNLSIGF
jgi:hypothetical protein